MNITDSEILNLYQEGYSRQDIKKQNKISWDYITKILVDNNVKIRTLGEDWKCKVQRKFKDEPIAETIKLYQEGLSAYDVAERVEKSATWVKNRLRKFNIPIRSQKESRSMPVAYERQRKKMQYDFSTEQIQDILKMYEEGYGMVFISKKYKVAELVINRILTEQNIKLRTKQEATKNPKRWELTKNTQFAKYGCYAASNPIVFEKRRLTNIKRYGCEHPMQNKGLREKNRITFLKHHGVDLIIQKLDKIQIEDIVNLYKSGYGIPYICKKYKVSRNVICKIFKDQNIKIRTPQESGEQSKKWEQIKETQFKRFNGNYAGFDPVIVEKRKQNCLKKYGCEHHMQNSNIIEKQNNSARLIKHTVIDGKKFSYQGYELKAINKLLQQGYKVDEIISGKKNIPRFKYFYNGKNHYYFPDLYIPKENKIIEVKSQYYFDKEKEKNLLKEQAVKDSNYDFEFMILTPKD